jgi:hypothetical protein
LLTQGLLIDRLIILQKVLKYFVLMTALQILYSILCAYNRRAELLRLIGWAKRKRLAGPIRLYQHRLLDEEIRLNRYTLRYPSLTRWARFIHRLNIVLFPAPRYYSRGVAASYRYKNLQTLKNNYRMLT